MRILYIGVVDFSYHCLEEVIKNKGNVVGIVTSHTQNSDFRNLTPISKQHNIPIHYFNKNVNEKQTLEWIKSKKPDIIFCWGISQLIRSEILSIPPMGVLGVHPALLPVNRGRHPLIWALALGLKESGLTFFFLDEGADSGPILSQKTFTIEENDDANILYKKIKKLATLQIAEFLPNLISEDYQFIQQDSGISNYWRKRSRIDGKIDWRMSKIAILNLVRALTKPYPGAETNYKDKDIAVWKAEEFNEEIAMNIEPGKIIKVIDNCPVIKCYDGSIMLTEYEPCIEFIEGDYII